jgi:hypothetical protein
MQSFKALYGHDASYDVVPPQLQSGHTDVQSLLQERQVFTDILKSQLARVQLKMKQYADANQT